MGTTTELRRATSGQSGLGPDAERVRIQFDVSAIHEIATIAAEVNASTENVGARRLHTVMERLLDARARGHERQHRRGVRVREAQTRTCRVTFSDLRIRAPSQPLHSV